MTDTDKIAALERIVAEQDQRIVSVERLLQGFIAFADTIYDAVIDLDHAISAAKIEGNGDLASGEKRE